MKKKIKNNRGASLIEVLVSMVLLAIGLLGAVSFSRIGSQALAHSDRITKVSAFAQAIMEEKLALPYRNLISENAENVVMQSGIQLTLKINHDNPFDDIATIEVIAQWKDAGGVEKQISFSAIKSSQILAEKTLP